MTPTTPLYKRWAFSPHTGEVALDDNTGDPLSVRYHGDLAHDLNEPDLVHGYAYRIGDGWRLTDWESQPITDNFIVASVMRKLQGEDRPHEDSWLEAGTDFSRIHHGLPT